MKRATQTVHRRMNPYGSLQPVDAWFLSHAKAMEDSVFEAALIQSPDVTSVHLEQLENTWFLSAQSFLADLRMEITTKCGNTDRFFATLTVQTKPVWTFSIQSLHRGSEAIRRKMWRLSPYLIPEIGEKEMEEALQNLSCLPPQRLAKHLGLTLRHLALYGEESVQGCLALSDTDMLVQGERNWPDLASVPARSLVINTKASSPDPEEEIVFHECIHAMWHALFFALWEEQTCEKDHPWLMSVQGIHPALMMEYQADTATQLYFHKERKVDVLPDAQQTGADPVMVFGRCYCDRNYMARTCFFLRDIIAREKVSVYEAQRIYLRTFPDTFHEALCLLMKQAKRQVTEFAIAVGISERKMVRLRHEERDVYEIEEVMRMLLELQLPPWLGEMFLERANLSLGASPRHRIFYFLVHAGYMDGIEAAEQLLLAEGVEGLVRSE